MSPRYEAAGEPGAPWGYGPAREAPSEYRRPQGAAGWLGAASLGGTGFRGMTVRAEEGREVAAGLFFQFLSH